jgi:transcriptional regulator with XRE-family HTH domain
MVAVAKKKPTGEAFGTRLKSFREAQGLTQTKLAEMVGVKRLTIVRYESGETEPSYSVLLLLQTALGLKSLDDFTE